MLRAAFFAGLVTPVHVITVAPALIAALDAVMVSTLFASAELVGVATLAGDVNLHESAVSVL